MNSHSLQYDAVLAAPFGAVAVFVHNDQVSIELLTEQHAPKPAAHKTAQKIANQIEAYFNNATHDFDLPIAQRGTPFQQRVWAAIGKIPCGRVLTYAELAAQVGSGARAVANACGANNLPLIIPCHRVVAKSSLGGFMQGNPDGLKVKKWLLKHEGIEIKGKPF
jgi:methylated-DNA-[protein]-cysteine S-methyltransferase